MIDGRVVALVSISVDVYIWELQLISAIDTVQLSVASSMHTSTSILTNQQLHHQRMNIAGFSAALVDNAR